MLGTQLEHAGWRQGSLVKASDLQHILRATDRSLEEGMQLVVASHSCDIANNHPEHGTLIELLVARPILSLNGNNTFGKNPRVFHTAIYVQTGDERVVEPVPVELRSYERFFAPKRAFQNLAPANDRQIAPEHLHSYAGWLAAQFSRPALPTEFNDRITRADPNKKLRDRAKKSNELFSGIYVEIFPDREIGADETYRVNLLGLTPGGSNIDAPRADNALDSFAQVLRDAGMDVAHRAISEDDISVGKMKQFKRFFYDDLSYKDETPLPPDLPQPSNT